MAELKPCPFCGGKARRYRGEHDNHGICCTKCSAKVYGYMSKAGASKAWNRRTTIETNIYDNEETYPNCTVQVLTNTATGDVSVGWWKNPPSGIDFDYGAECE